MMNKIIEKLSVFISDLRRPAKIAKQMVIRLTIFIVVPVLIVGIFLVRYSYNTLYRQTIQQVESDNLRVKSILVDSFINVANIAEEIYNERLLQQYLMSSSVEFEIEKMVLNNIDNRITSILRKNTFISSIHIYTTNQAIDDSNHISIASEAIVKECFTKADVPASSIWGTFPTVSKDKDNPEIILICTFPLEKSDNPAILVINISSNYLRNRIQNNTLTTMLSVDNSNVFFSTIRSLQDTPMPVEVDYTKKYYSHKGIFFFRGEKEIGCIDTLPIYLSNNTLYVYTLDLEAHNQIITVLITNILIIIGIILVAIFGIIFHASYLSRRIVSLKSSMKGARDGNYDDIIDSLRGDDELTETFNDLKALIKDVKKKDAKMYEAQIKEQKFLSEQSKMEAKLLSNQINPHFLYNTLETIRMLALKANAREAANAIVLLAKSMRYVLDNSMVYSTTLKKELDYIEVYLKIQQIRFQERLDYKIEIEDSINPVHHQIVPLLIQPIVENAVIHGLESVEKKVMITIRVKEEKNNTLMISIEDTGYGMDEETLKSLQSSLLPGAPNNNSSIGLQNIQKRINLLYGQNYGMVIESSRNKGTYIKLVLPYDIHA
ncbi:MAG: hypothetical protein EWM47_12275 [Anaerolineaceae bacterium]|nr:MAG: hypothetical protein EWM47_12275 [Anaerolineaceae bacterium]